MSIIELLNLSMTFENGGHRTPVLRGIDLLIGEGSSTAIIGRSGSGKSTLMNIIGLLLTPTSGRYRLLDASVGDLDAGKRARIRNRHLGFVFQNYHLMPRMTVIENVWLPLLYDRTQRFSRWKARARAEACLDMVGLADRAAQHPNTLSGGEQQRVALARAMVNDPSVVLADEPTGALDSENGEHVIDLLGAMSRRDGKTVVVITHDRQVAARCRHRIHLVDGALT